MFPEFFPSRLDGFAARPCLIVPGERVWSYGEILALADEIGRAAGDGRRLVFVEGSNSVASIAAYLGCLRAGHVVHLIDPLRDNSGLIAAFQPHAVIRSEAAAWDVEILHTQTLVLHPDLAVLLSTSGSTGAQKLVKLSRRNIEANTLSIIEYLGLTANDRSITTLKPYYSYGLSVINSHLAAGGSLVLTERSLQDAAFWSELRAHRPTNFAGVPHSFEMLDAMKQDLSGLGLRFVTQAGGRLAPGLVKKFARMSFEFFVMYGQTEAGPRISYLPPRLAAQYPDCIGIAIPGGELSLHEGELTYAGPNIMMGYATGVDDLATKEDIPLLFTGDLAVRNEAGLYRITGRKARFVKPFGVRVSLDEIERFFEVPVAAVGTDAQITLFSEQPVDLNAIAAHCALPERLFRTVRLPLPRLSSGKIDYRALAQEKPGFLEFLHLLIQRTIAEATSIVTGKQEQWTSVEDIYQIHFPTRRIAANDSFVSLGGDSLSYVQVSLSLEDFIGDLPANWHERSVAELEALHAA